MKTVLIHFPAFWVFSLEKNWLLKFLLANFKFFFSVFRCKMNYLLAKKKNLEFSWQRVTFFQEVKIFWSIFLKKSQIFSRKVKYFQDTWKMYGQVFSRKSSIFKKSHFFSRKVTFFQKREKWMVIFFQKNLKWVRKNRKYQLSFVDL